MNKCANIIGNILLRNLETDGYGIFDEAATHSSHLR